MKSEYPFLSKAPIVEAVLEIRTTPAASWDSNIVTSKAKETFAEGYSYEDENMLEQTFQFKPHPAEPLNISKIEWNGLRLTSQDKTEILKIIRDSYVFSKLKPYTGWEKFQERALDGWNIYRDIAGRQSIKRIGIRFINRIEFTNDELPDLFSIYPMLVGKMTKEIAGYFQQNIYSFKGGEYQASYIQTIQPPAIGGGNPCVILDIDVYTAETLRIDEKEILSYLEQIRGMKNDIFFGAVKDELLRRLL